MFVAARTKKISQRILNSETSLLPCVTQLYLLKVLIVECIILVPQNRHMKILSCIVCPQYLSLSVAFPIPNLQPRTLGNIVIMPPLCVKGIRSSFYICFLAFWLIIVVTVFETYENKKNSITERKAAEHFFFDLLPMFDPEPPKFIYKSIHRVKSSAFTVIYFVFPLPTLL